MKKLLSLVLVATIIFIVGCEKNIIKTEYTLNELAEKDGFVLKLTKATKLENDILELVFEIENKQDKTITIAADTYFRLYDINQVQIPNIYQGNNTILKSNEKINYTLQYEVSDKNIYEILFYSGVVENNIKFTITSSDIEG